MTIQEIRKLNYNELRKLSLQKKHNGKYTADADRAMKVRRERSLYWTDVPKHPPSVERMELEYQGYTAADWD